MVQKTLTLLTHLTFLQFQAHVFNMADWKLTFLTFLTFLQFRAFVGGKACSKQLRCQKVCFLHALKAPMVQKTFNILTLLTCLQFRAHFLNMAHLELFFKHFCSCERFWGEICSRQLKC